MTEADAPQEAAPDAPETEETWQIVLRDGDPTALVRTPNEVVDNVPILTVKPEENADQALEGVEHDAVLLEEGRDTARVRVKDHIEDNVPLFKERADHGEPSREIRVRIREIREHLPKKTKNPLKRLFS